ncbi:MAG TPA: sugar phosphate isomerase/epimerase family protein [Solirubrobacteraceae bacterium]|nr:sugar phosphate isomerase/epimerase family protein [Solirubrobacteraceae bacterium]
MTDAGRLSLNLITVDHWSLEEAVERCAAAGIEWLAPWRHQLAADAPAVISAAGLRVSSLCRGGFFTARGAEDDNRRAVDEAAALGAPVLVLVCGPPVDGDLSGARATIAAGIERLLPYAASCGVRLGIEPLHPMMVGERSAIVTLGEALALARSFEDPAVGVVVDAYHVFWDPRLDDELAGAGGLIAGYHVSDWLVPTPDLLAGRGLMGDGIIDLPRLRGLVEAAGYSGPVEVEVINPALAAVPPDELLADIVARFAST